jgi:hypothetical protein
MTSEFIVQVKFPDGTILTIWNDEHRTCQYIGTGSASRCIHGDTWENCIREFDKVGRNNCKISTNLFETYIVEGDRHDTNSGGVCKPAYAFFTGDKWVSRHYVGKSIDEPIRQ